MIEYITLALLAYICYQDYYNRKERKRLIDAFLAKNLKELNETEKKIEKVDVVKQQPDILLAEATNEEFDKAIKKTVGTETILEKAASRLKGVMKYGR